MAFHEGDSITITSTVTPPESSTPVEPGSISFTVLTPKGRKESLSSSKVSTGVFEASVELEEAGVYVVSVLTTAPYRASQPETITVFERFAHK